MEPLDQHDPRRIGPFEVLGRLGKGGMGLVYLGRSTAGRRVAIKTVRAELAEDKLFRTRFEREIRAARTVGGFYTAAVVDADAQAPVPWLATAYVPAPSLEDLVVHTGPLPVGAVRWLAAGIAEALQSIHRADLIHRDLKPSNVLVVEDGPRVIDFGIAAGGQYTRVTMTNVAVGTPAYMSPEQARNSRGVTGPSDVFSLGSTLVYAATGHAPYRGSGPVDIVSQLLNREPDLSGLPDDLRPLIKACLRHELNRRPTPEEIQAELAPQLFSAGEAGGGAAMWLPGPALDFIEERSGRHISRPEPGPPPPMVPTPAPPAPPEPVAPPGPARHDSGQQGGDPSNIHIAVERAARELPPRPPSAPPGLQPTPRPEPAPPLSSPVPSPSAPSRAPSFPPAPVEPSPAPSVPVQPAPSEPIRLAGSGIAVGPGPKAAEAAAVPEPEGASILWARREEPGAVAAPPAPATPPQEAPVGHPVTPTPPHPIVPEPPVAPAMPPRPLRAPEPPPEYRRPDDWRPWRFRMSNGVWGSPQIWGGVVYVSSFEVHALELGSGQRRFKSTSPVWTMRVADGRVHSADGPSVYTFDARTGTPVWQLTAGGWVYSVRVGGGAVVAGTRGGGVQAWNAADGSPLWQVLDAQVSHESPTTGLEILGERVLYYGESGSGLLLNAVDLRTGAALWSVPVGGRLPLRPAAGPDGVLYAAAGSAVYALEPHSGGVLWRFDAPAEIGAPPTVAEDGGAPAVLVTDLAGGVHLLGAADGQPRWQNRIDGRPSAEAPTAAAGVVVIVAGAAVHAFGARDGQFRWRFDARAPIVGAPASAEGLLHIGSRDHRLYTLEAATGRLRWRLETGGEITGSPTVEGGAVCVCSADNCVYALDAAKGTDTKR
ncbi:hypothetical protein BIV57_15785 [Mangrovactinospora gilvigrisea]|uniref:Protein kinase domain-containing protein n=1 Tax=Mangrovactinospora gilvigrisea TaxID=1428644 RepID=A0A1J7C4P5_9ACTN|nr:serine/threonine-protein kinase [Mangrovactinospora gilvigrisea]OIV36532.1 hypothetical protein BIV57_15785 [Mangrovactinospora gilvigrisea]